MTDWLQTASPASAARPAGDKRRLALDGEAYTFEEFATYYGFENGVAIWRKSECLDSAAPPVAITASDPEDSAELPVAITASDPEDTAVSSSEQGFVHAGRHYAGVAGSHPVFVPPDDFFIPQPQLWTRCACPHHCYVCVYDGTSLCRGCDPVLTTQCECEPGCCDVLPSGESDSCDEGTTEQTDSPSTLHVSADAMSRRGATEHAHQLQASSSWESPTVQATVPTHDVEIPPGSIPLCASSVTMDPTLPSH